MPPVGLITSHSEPKLSTDQAQLLVILIGVNQYQDESLPTLRYSAVDCQGLGEALQELQQPFAHKQFLVHHDFAPLAPQRHLVLASIKQLVRAAKPQDTLLVYFSGHGVLEPQTQEAVLCLADTRRENLLSTGIKVTQLLKLLGDCAAHQQLVWLDACHSGGMTLRGARQMLTNPTPQLVEVLRQRAQTTQGFYALLSCDQGQQAWEFPQLGHGVFTYYLMQGLRGGAATSQGIINADGLYRYVYHHTLQYIDNTNQQLRLINQQQRSRSQTQLQPEYPLQTPKRIVEGVGEIILGVTQGKSAQKDSRHAFVVEGLSGSNTILELSKLLRQTGQFELDYFPQPGKPWSQVQDAMATGWQNISQSSSVTILLYLRGRIEQTSAGEAWLVISDELRLSRSWLRQILRQSQSAKQIIILDFPGSSTPEESLLEQWVEDLQLGSVAGQCFLAAASPPHAPDKFAQALLNTLQPRDELAGLSVAGWITQLQGEMAEIDIPFHVWLSGAQGIMEIIPSQERTPKPEARQGLDLGLCPYMGLQAFTASDKKYFYGREILTQKLCHHLRQESFLAVVGASGSGKSSLVQAGLMAQIRQGEQLPGSEQWLIKSMRPGAHPLQALAASLVDWGTTKERNYEKLQIEGLLHLGGEGFRQWLRSHQEPMVVLVVDQFEELFTTSSEPERQQFLQLLLGALADANDRFKLVITLRADFISPCLEHPTLAELLQNSSVLIPPHLSADDYRRVIVKPAEKVGLYVEPELVELLCQELHNSPGYLPLLEFVLEQLWLHREVGALTLHTYQQQIGGIKGALERKAQEVWESLDSQGQACAKWIFLTLTQLGEGTEDTRRRILKSELVVQKYPAELVNKTLQTLTAAKLVVVNSLISEGDGVSGRWGERETGRAGDGESGRRGDGEMGRRGDKGETTPYPLPLTPYPSPVTIEVTHEILIRHWSTLRWWLEENRARLRLQRQIEQAAQLWKQHGKQPDFLLQGARLAQAEEIYIQYTNELSEDVQVFIDACLQHRQQEQRREKKRLRQVKAAATAIAMLGIAALGLGGFAYWQSQKVRVSQVEALNSLSNSLLTSHQQLEALMASVRAGKQLQSLEIWGRDVPELRASTQKSLQKTVYSTHERNRLQGHTDWVLDVSFSPDGQLLASGSADGTAKLWSRDGKLLRTLSAQEQVIGVNFSPDGKLLATANADGSVQVWHLDGHLLHTLAGHENLVVNVSFSPDGNTLASASFDGTVKLWNREGKLLRTLVGHQGGAIAVQFSPDGQTIASTGFDHNIKLWNRQGQLLNTLKGHTKGVSSISFSPDGQLLASASDDETIKIWHKEGKLLQTITGHERTVYDISFSPDGQLLASAGYDQTIKIWHRDGTLRRTLQGHGLQVNSISFSADSKLLASASHDRTVKLWHLDDTKLTNLRGHQKGVISARFSPDGALIASASMDYSAKLWNREGKLLKTLSGHTNEVNQVSFSPDGDILATASDDAKIKLWNRQGELLTTLKGHEGWVLDVSFSPDGQTIVSGSADGTVKLWHRDGRLLKTFSGHENWVRRVRFHPQGNKIATSSFDNTIKLWKLDGTLEKTLQPGNLPVKALDFSPNGKFLASASADTIKLWSSEGELISTFAAHAEPVNSEPINDIAFSPDSQMLVSASDDNTIKLWNLQGQQLQMLDGYSENFRGANFSRDGKVIIAASEDGTVKLWNFQANKPRNLTLSQLLEDACTQLEDYLHHNSQLQKLDRTLCEN